MILNFHHTRDCPKCKKPMDFKGESSDSLKFKCTNADCRAVFFFDADDEPTPERERILDAVFTRL